jgi:hypothetical protein
LHSQAPRNVQRAAATIMSPLHRVPRSGRHRVKSDPVKQCQFIHWKPGLTPSHLISSGLNPRSIAVSVHSTAHHASSNKQQRKTRPSPLGTQRDRLGDLAARACASDVRRRCLRESRSASHGRSREWKSSHELGSKTGDLRLGGARAFLVSLNAMETEGGRIFVLKDWDLVSTGETEEMLKRFH